MIFPGEGIISGIATGALSYLGAREANTANREMAQNQMDFQERMSNTAYQRSVEDMKRAGLNPMLAYQQGGASTPGGSTATMKNELSGAVASAMEARRMALELDNMKAINERTKAETQAIQSLIPEKAFRGRVASGVNNLSEYIRQKVMPGISSGQDVKTYTMPDPLKKYQGKGFLSPIPDPLKKYKK